ncbi:MAG: Mur ligase family protein [Candidatus Falkowbacteria bacterium]
MNKVVQIVLKVLAKIVVTKYHPEIIGITGSIGKTSAKEAVYKVLSPHFNVRQSQKNYNNELGVPLTILGVDAPGKSLIGWFKVFSKFFSLVFKTDNDYPPILILEMGIDRVGDMKYLMSIARPHIGIVTSVSHSHLEHFVNVENIKKEKQILITNVTKNGLAILNYDNEWTRQMLKESRSKVLSYGFEDGADVLGQEVSFSSLKDGGAITGVNFKVNHNGSIVPFSIPGAVGYPAVYAILAAVAVGVYYQINLIDVANSLMEFSLPAGRLRPITGINNSTIIDDTYNAAADSTLAAIDVLENIKTTSGRKLMALGDMLELGDESEADHIKVGERIAEFDPEILFLVGEKAMLIGAGAIDKDYDKNKIVYLSDSQQAAKEIPGKILPGDIILVKGSQGARMERVVKSLMANPDEAENLLVRQGKAWN